MVRKPSTGEIIAKSANQIVPLKFCGGKKNITLYSPSPFPLGGLKGVSRYETKWAPAILDYMKKVTWNIILSTMVLAPNSNFDSFLVANCIFSFNVIVTSS